MAERINLVVFDLGGVLVRIARSWAEAHALAGLAPHPILESEQFSLLSARLTADYQTGKITSGQYYRLIADGSGGAYLPADVQRVMTAWSRDEYPEVARVFDAVESVGIQTAILSNTNPAHWQRLAAIGVDAPEYPTILRAKHHFASHLLGIAKPEPAIYEALIHATETQANRILFFDDSHEHVLAARASGWSAEQIDHAGDTASQMLELLRRYDVIPKAT